MNFRLTAILFAAVLVVGVLLLVLTFSGDEKGVPTDVLAEELAALKPDQIDTVEMEREGGSHLKLVRVSKDRWDEEWDVTGAGGGKEQVRAKRAYTRYTASIGVMTMDNTLISRAVVQNEFRTAADLVDRVGGGAGGAVKAVAPTGIESISIQIPESESQVSLLGEKLTVEGIDGNVTYSQPGRPIAVVSNVMLEYRPGPAPKTPPKKRDH